MFLVRARRKLTALVALTAFAFAQAAIAAMGCAALVADPGRQNVAVMPSGEPCEMLGATPAPLVQQHLMADASCGTGDAPPQLSDIGAGGIVPVLVPQPVKAGVTVSLCAPRNLGPPPFRLTRRLRI